VERDDLLETDEIQDAMDELQSVTFRPLREFVVIYALVAIERLGSRRAAALEIEVNQSTLYRWLRDYDVAGILEDR